MTKFLVSTADGSVRSAHVPPLDFSVSGRFVVDVPDDVSVSADTASLADLLAEKIAGIGARPLVRGLPLSQYDELLSSPNVDPALSGRCFLGPNKRCSMFPGGTIVTNPIPISSSASHIYFHWYGFLLASEPGPRPPSAVPARPPPPRLLYNYDVLAESFVELDPSSLSVQVWDSTFSSMLLNVDFETVQPFSFGPGSVRLKFQNTSGSIQRLSDWAFFHD